MNSEEESWNPLIPFREGYGIRVPSYTYWNVAYGLSLEGNLNLNNQFFLCHCKFQFN